MINSIQETPITVLADSNILFSSDAVRTRCANCCGFLEHEVGSGLFTLTKTGIYEIELNMNITSATAGALPFTMTINGEQATGTEMDYTVATANVYQNVGFNRLIRVCGNGSKTIAIENISDSTALVKNASLIIKKVA